MACYNESMDDKSFAHLEPSKTRRSDDSAAAGHARQSGNACFDCSICLDSAVDPVVTLCGHLYCWPCIYKWLQVDTTFPQPCPVCKSPLSVNTLVPLYGRGNSSAAGKTKSLDVPNRPVALRDAIESVSMHRQRPLVRQHRNHHYYPSPWGGMGVFGSTAGGVLGGLAIAALSLVSRNNQDAAGEMYLSRLNHLMPGSSSASRRMQERKVEDSLHQIWVFLFCCAILGLLFF